VVSILDSGLIELMQVLITSKVGWNWWNKNYRSMSYPILRSMTHSRDDVNCENFRPEIAVYSCTIIVEFGGLSVCNI